MQKQENKNFESELDSAQLQELTANVSEGAKTIDKNLEVTENRDAEEHQNKHYSRRQRRPIQKMMERQQKKMYKSTNLDFKGFAQRVRQNQNNGNTLHDRYMQNMAVKEENWFMDKEKEVRASLEARGLTKAEIDLHIEEWYDSVKIWSEGVQ